MLKCQHSTNPALLYRAVCLVGTGPVTERVLGFLLNELKMLKKNIVITDPFETYYGKFHKKPGVLAKTFSLNKLPVPSFLQKPGQKVINRYMVDPAYRSVSKCGLAIICPPVNDSPVIADVTATLGRLRVPLLHTIYKNDQVDVVPGHLEKIAKILQFLT